MPAADSTKVRIRMYRQGLGDCFLLSFGREDREPFHLMIDCGVITGTENPEKIMSDVVKDIIATTGGRVDVLAVTHEHWDHVSGFDQAESLFLKADREAGPGRAGLRVGELWLGWTENPADKLANSLSMERRKAEQALRESAARLKAMGVGAAARIDSLVTSFFEARGGQTKRALDVARGLVKGSPCYCRPSAPPIRLPDLPGVRFFVLGPPEDPKRIRKTSPSKKNPEVYELSGYLSPEAGFFAEGSSAVAGSEGESGDQPFDRALRIPEAAAKGDDFFKEFYWGEYGDRDIGDQEFRRIDGAWFAAAEQFALQLDNATNNTSLVLAIELIDSGKVLLFPGDAQVGSWLSWEDLKWTVRGKNGVEEVRGHDLLGRTVFYKVGHHGSHNATLREKGLELMGSDLRAMLPVDRAMAVRKGWKHMPLDGLVNCLKVKTNGRLQRSDEGAGLYCETDISY